MPADPGPRLRAAALTPRSPLDTAAVLRRARRLRTHRRAGLATAALAVAVPLLVLPMSRAGLRFTSPDAAGEAAATAEQHCARLAPPRTPDENGFTALGLSDELPLRLVERTTVIADSCVVDDRSESVLGAILRLEDEAGETVAGWLLLPDGAAEDSSALVPFLLHAGPVGDGQVVERDGALAIVSDADLAIVAGDPSEPQVSAWEALTRSGPQEDFTLAVFVPRATRSVPTLDDMAPRYEGLAQDSRTLPSGIGTRLVLPSGRELEVVLPAEVQAEPRLRYRPESVGIVRDEPRTPQTSVTTASAREVAGGALSDGPTRLPNGAVLETWRGGLGAEPLVTASLAGWTLVLDGPDGGLAERIVGALDWSVDAEGFLLLASTDPQVLIADGVTLAVPVEDGDLALSLTHGCESADEALERSPGLGVWCVNDYAVVAQSSDSRVLTALHDQFRVVAAPRENASGGTTVYRDYAVGLRVTYPRGWARAPERLTPNLGGVGGPGDLVEVVSIGTGSLSVGGDDCANIPERAVEALGPGDALVTVQERVAPEGFPARPARFGAPDGDLLATLECFANADEVEHVRYDFADGGRGFYGYVTFHRDATAQVRAEALAILDSLVVEPR